MMPPFPYRGIHERRYRQAGKEKRGRREKERERNKRVGRSGSSSRVYCIVQRVRQSTTLPPRPPPGHPSSISAYGARAHACTYARIHVRSAVAERIDGSISSAFYTGDLLCFPSRVCGRNATIERHRHEITIALGKNRRGTRRLLFALSNKRVGQGNQVAPF